MNPRPQISPATWERLSSLREGDLTGDEAGALSGDPALADARRALDDQITALSAPYAAPPGFADRVLRAVEHEPIPANTPLWGASRPWWRRVEVALVALAAAAVLVVAVPKPVPVADAPGQIALPRQPPPPDAPPADPVLPPAAPASAGPRPPAAAKTQGEPTLGAGATQPAPDLPPEASGAEIAADPEPAWARRYGYAMTASDPAAVRRLRDTVLGLGTHLEDGEGQPVSAATLAETGGSVFLTIQADQLPELDRRLRELGAVQGHRDTEALGTGALEVQIVVELPRGNP